MKHLKAEAEGFAKAAVTPQAGALIGLFINDQVVKKTSKKYEKGAHPVNESGCSRRRYHGWWYCLPSGKQRHTNHHERHW